MLEAGDHGALCLPLCPGKLASPWLGSDIDGSWLSEPLVFAPSVISLLEMWSCLCSGFLWLRVLRLLSDEPSLSQPAQEPASLSRDTVPESVNFPLTSPLQDSKIFIPFLSGFHPCPAILGCTGIHRSVPQAWEQQWSRKQQAKSREPEVW